MKKRKLILTLTCLILLFALSGLGQEARAASYMSNKTEIPVDLEVSGAEALCQTQDGYVWIAQYSGLTRYDSKEFVTYKSFEFEGKEYSVINVRALASKGNDLYVATSENVYVYKNSRFEPLVVEPGVIVDVILDEARDTLYISTQNNGGVIYDVANKTKTTIPGTEGKYVDDIALGASEGTYYYHVNEGVFDSNGKLILANPRILETYSN